MSCALSILTKLSLFTDTYLTSSNVINIDNQHFYVYMFQIWV